MRGTLCLTTDLFPQPWQVTGLPFIAVLGKSPRSHMLVMIVCIEQAYKMSATRLGVSDVCHWVTLVLVCFWPFQWYQPAHPC